MKFFYSLILLLLIASCINIDTSKIDTEVAALNTADKQAIFLEEIHDLDQKVRTDARAIQVKFGFNSKEHREAETHMNKTDLENLAKIEAYFKHFGHPKKDIHGKLAAGTPWLVLHHQSDYGPREDNFPFIYKAFKEEDIDGGAFTFFLNRMYDWKFDERIKYEGSFTEKFEIDTITRALNLTDMMKEVDLSLEK